MRFRWSLFFIQPKKFSIGFKSGLWLGQSNWFLGIFSFIQAFANREVCFGSLSCIKIQLSPWKALAWSAKCHFNICTKNCASIFCVKIHNVKVPIAEYAAQIWILGECLTVGRTLFWLPFVHNRILPLLSQKDASSLNTALHHLLFLFPFAHSILFWWFFSLNMGTLVGWGLEYPKPFRHLWTVLFEALILLLQRISDAISLTGFWG